MQYFWRVRKKSVCPSQFKLGEFLKGKKWIYALCLLALTINLSVYLLFLHAILDKNNLIFSSSLSFLSINLFCVIPLGFPLYFPFAITRSIKRELTKDLSSLKNLVLITKIARLFYTILLQMMWGLAIIVLSIVITYNIFGQADIIEKLYYPMLFSLGGTILLLLHTFTFASLMGYPSLWRFWPTSKKSFFEEIDEARMFLLFSCRLIKKKYKEGITLLAYSLLRLDEALTKEERWTTPRKMENLDSTLEILEAVGTTDYGESKKSTITDLQEKILALIDEKRLHELPVTLSNFVNEKELESFKGFPTRPKIRISGRSVSILMIIFASLGSLLSLTFLKILEVATAQYPQLLCFAGITFVLIIISYFFVFRRPAILYPLPLDVISALAKKT